MRPIALATLVAFGQMLTPQACGRPGPQPPTDPVVTDRFTTTDGISLGVQTIVTGLEIPWSLAFAPDGRLFFTERPGRVRVYQNGALLSQPALVLDDVRIDGEGGLLGIALDPQFAATRFVYLLYTANTGAGPVNRLVRYREVNNTLADRAVLVDGIGAAAIHDGGRLRFGPDEQLYLTMGDVAEPSRAQSLASLNGKILRLTPAGLPSPGNPFGSEIWSWGHRNPQGIDWHPVTGDLWATEHGQTANDELNLIRPGVNYGWPVIEADETRPDMESPKLFFTPPAVAPSGLSFYDHARMPGLQRNLFFATLRGQHIHRVRLDPADPTRLLATERLLDGRFGRIRDVVAGPDGALYFCTNNRDGRGSPISTDDRIARIVPAG
jgi:glucose/arabinose dehydrogenase